MFDSRRPRLRVLAMLRRGARPRSATSGRGSRRSRGAAGLLGVIAVSGVSGLVFESGQADTLNVKSPLIVESSFESAALDPAIWVKSGTAPVPTKEQARAGSYSLKSVVDYYGSGHDYRSEVTQQWEFPSFDKEYWYGFSVFVPDSYVPDGSWEIVAQFQSIPNDGEEYRNPLLAIETSGGIWGVRSRWDDKVITQTKSGGGWVYGGQKRWELGEVKTGVWTDWVIQVKWRYVNDKQGYLKIWKDGKLVVDHTGPNAYNDPMGPYLKLGIYNGWKSTPPQSKESSRYVVYHDEIRVAGPGGSYELVAPGGGKQQEEKKRPRPPGSFSSSVLRR